MNTTTWVFKKVDAIDDKAKADEIENALEIEELVNCICDDVERSVRSELRMQRLKTEGFDYLIKMRMEEDCNRIFVSEDGTVYWAIAWDKPFRVYGMPTVKLFSEEDVLQWLKDYSKANTVGYNIPGPEEGQPIFKTGYTKELENRIKAYFKKHGKDNLCFMFR